MKRLLVSVVDAVLVAVAAHARTEWVDPFIGTAGTGHTFPAACVPFGLVQAGADTGYGGWEHCSGYRFGDKTIWGFTQTHLNGTGGKDLCDVRLLPFRGEKSAPIPFDHADERAAPGYYSVFLKAIDLRVEAAPTAHAAIYRMTATADGELKLQVDPKSMFGKPIRSASGTSGVYRWKRWAERDVGYQVVFSRTARPTDDPAVVAFDLRKGEALLVKVGLSSGTGAEANLRAEIPDWDFDCVRASARQAWEEILSRATVEGSDEQKRSWYTSIYHLCIQPNNLADAGAKPFYSTFSCWDTFRAAGPLYTVICPERAAEFVDSLLEQGRRTGHLPVWPLWGCETECMIGTHSVPMIVDAILKGVWKGDEAAAYRQIRETLTQRHEGRIKERWDLYDRYGYYPFDLLKDGKVKGESVSRTLECAYDDWCAAQLAKRLGKAADAAFFLKRAASWKNVFDPSVGLVRGKDSSGRWREPFDPYALGEGFWLDSDYTEGNAFHYTFHVMQDPEGLIAAMGGREKFGAALDALFERPSKLKGQHEVGDVTGLIGQYAHGNEPCHHVIYFYPLIGRPDAAARRIREVFDRFYLPKPDGLCGNDDCGQMSAWYLFGAMGFYPFNPCGGDYVIGAPQVPAVTLSLPGGKTFRMVAKGLSRERGVVKSVTLNGKPLAGCVLRHADIMSGGELVFEMRAPSGVNRFQ